MSCRVCVKKCGLGKSYGYNPSNLSSNPSIVIPQNYNTITAINECDNSSIQTSTLQR